MAEAYPKTPRAKFVCHACNVRKKACNKALPACSFCAARNLQCRYDIMALSKKGQRKYNPGRSFVALEPPSPPLSTSATCIPSVIPVPEATLKDSTETHSVDGFINQQVLNIFKFAGRTPADVSDYYFETFHQACPIISSDLFKDVLSQYLRVNYVPSADVSILLLAMCLVTALPCLDRPLHLSSMRRDWLYATTKSLFAQANAAVSNSLPLVQAVFLISVCEYSCARPEAAHVSINTCHLLAEMLGITNVTLDTSKSPTKLFKTQQENIERRNIASAIATFERLILIELDFIKPSPRTECHDMRSFLPLQPGLNDQNESEPPISPVSSNVGPTHDDMFECQAQIVLLLDLILRTTHYVSETNKNSVLSELASLDVKLRALLGVLMFESSKRQDSLCGRVALSVRCLFLLHRTTLSILPTGDNERDQQAKTISQAALGTACEMVSDAMELTATKKIMPITCYYNLQATIKWLQERKDHSGDEALSLRLEPLLQSRETYWRKCVF